MLAGVWKEDADVSSSCPGSLKVWRRLLALKCLLQAGGLPFFLGRNASFPQCGAPVGHSRWDLPSPFWLWRLIHRLPPSLRWMLCPDLGPSALGTAAGRGAAGGERLFCLVFLCFFSSGSSQLSPPACPAAVRPLCVAPGRGRWVPGARVLRAAGRDAAPGSPLRPRTRRALLSFGGLPPAPPRC